MVLDAAIDRQYPASSAERFFTGGGIHTFSNFDATDDHRRLSVREAFRQSVNLVFIRLLRDLVDHHTYLLTGFTPEVLTNPEHPARRTLLERFAEREGRRRAADLHEKYTGRASGEVLEGIAKVAGPSSSRLAWAFRAVAPDAPARELERYLRRHGSDPFIAATAVRELYDRSAPHPYTLSDLGYLSGVDPIELWTARRLRANPGTTEEDLVAASAEARREAFLWLFETRHKEAQDRRIRTLLEQDAFREIHRRWKALGYPFYNLVPSLATAIGSSGDRPASLAELVGIVLNDGIRRPTIRIRALHFAEDTPYETRMVRDPAPGVRVLSVPVAAAVRRALVDVVEHGTGRRARGAFVESTDETISIGGKTGTGDNRIKEFGSGGRVVGSRPTSRTATFVFHFGERFFGVVTATVLGPEAGNYEFTSSLPAQIFRLLGPTLKELTERPAEEPPERHPAPWWTRDIRMAGLAPDADGGPNGPRLASWASVAARESCPRVAQKTDRGEGVWAASVDVLAQSGCVPDWKEGDHSDVGNADCCQALTRLARMLPDRRRIGGSAAGIRDPPDEREEA